jgi:integrase/recombinase XerD
MQMLVVVDEFLNFCRIERQLSAHTLAAYASDLADFYRWLGRAVDVAEISTEDLKKYLEEMVDGRRLSPATVRRRLACLRSFFRRVSECGLAPSPLDAWRPKLPRRKRLPRSLAKAEAVSLLNSTRSRTVADSERNLSLHVAIQLMIATGIRVGELCKLRVEDVADDGSLVRIQGKGSRDRVAFVADTSLKRNLRELLDERRRRHTASQALFLNRFGCDMRPQSVRSRLRRLAKSAGLVRRVTPHMLRHTAATLLIETGVDIRFVQRLLGHSSIATTEIYTHVSDQALKATLERADVLASLHMS